MEGAKGVHYVCLPSLLHLLTTILKFIATVSLLTILVQYFHSFEIKSQSLNFSVCLRHAHSCTQGSHDTNSLSKVMVGGTIVRPTLSVCEQFLPPTPGYCYEYHLLVLLNHHGDLCTQKPYILLKASAM